MTTTDPASRPADRPEPRPAHRPRFADLVVLAAEVAVGAGWSRFVRPIHDRHPVYITIGRFDFVIKRVIPFCNELFPFLAVLMMATLVLRVLPPRPRPCDLARQSGWIACLAATVVSVVCWAYLLGLAFLVRTVDPGGASRGQIDQLLTSYRLDLGFFDPGLFILTAWMTQRLLHRGEVESDWVDRLGRGLGWCCLTLSAIRIFSQILMKLSGLGWGLP